MQHYSCTNASATVRVQEEQDTLVRSGPASGGNNFTHPDIYPVILQTMAAGISSGISPVQFMDCIQVGNRQLGNRAFVRWVGELRSREQDPGIQQVAGSGLLEPGRSLTRQAPLQLMSKKKKKKGEPVVVETSGETSEATPEVSAAPGAQAESEVLLPQEGPREATMPGEKKKKKKSRVQVALNTLRAEGVEAFKRYIEEEITVVDLLCNMRDRINRAENLGRIKEAALGVVEERIRTLDPGAGLITSMAGVSGPSPGIEEPVRAKVKTTFSQREIELFMCCSRGNVAKFKRLLKFGAVDVNMSVESGTLLCCAALKGYAVIFRVLLSVPGIDVNLAQKEGATPLYLAAQEGHTEVVKLLLNAPGIDVNLAELSGNTPLSIATQYEREEIVRLLLTVPNIKPDVQRDDGASPLCLAVQSGHSGIVALLLKRGADVNLTIYEGSSPLCIAAKYGSIEIVRLLLQVPDIQINWIKKDGATALNIASQQVYTEVVKLLLRKGADPNIVTFAGVAPLHVACLRGYSTIAQMLLHAGADTEAELANAEKHTPYGLARLGGHRGIMSLLEKHRREKAEQLPRIESLSPCLPPAEPAPLLTTCRARPPAYDLQSPPLRKQGGRLCESRGEGSAKAGGQALADQPGQIAPSTSLSPEPAPLPGTQPTAQPGNVPLTPPIAPASQVTDTMEPADTTPASALSEPSSSARPDKQLQATKTPSPLDTAKDELIREILRKLDQDNLESLEGIRLMVEVRATDSIDSLCGLYNRLAGIERQKERARRRKVRRKTASTGAEAMPPDTVLTFALGQKRNLSAEAVEGEIKRHLSQSNHRFVSQAVNDMEFGRGKPTTGYPGMWHVSAGISGVGSCSVFFYADEETRVIRIVGIGHHAGRAAYQLDYAVGELGDSGRVLNLVKR